MMLSDQILECAEAEHGDGEKKAKPRLPRFMVRFGQNGYESDVSNGRGEGEDEGEGPSDRAEVCQIDEGTVREE